MCYQSRAISILNKLSQFKTISTIDLSNELGVSVETIRRDLKKLAVKGELIRVHGGAEYKKLQDIGSSFNSRAGENYKEKIELTKKAISYIYENSVIGLDPSSSSWMIAKNMPDIKCTVITNSLIKWLGISIINHSDSDT
ncbi:DeoR family transcriptional regulator [Photobacterium damselae]|uniref:DeoR family transcriptional regulator n=1 Tax=Photobacterium damselae TaxID=38293 RepID=UPI001EFE7FA1|nr:DeoR family transcriptional regulator [Photobacterium damselae]MCG9780684.1 DeoR family transcriptional regulator [Photobacterium damselae]